MKDLLDVLVTSETRKQLLKLLWGEKLEGSAHQLSQLAGCSYAVVHGELKELEEGELVRKTRKGRAHLYSREPYSPHAALIEQLVNASFHQEMNETDVVGALASLGAPIASEKKFLAEFEKERVFVLGVVLAQREATVARALPVGLAKWEKQLDFKRLHFWAQKENVTQEMGFFLDLTSELNGSKNLKKQAREFRDKRFKMPRPFFKNADSQSPRMKEAEERNTPQVARRWHFRINMGFDSFKSLFEKSIDEEV